MLFLSPVCATNAQLSLLRYHYSSILTVPLYRCAQGLRCKTHRHKDAAILHKDVGVHLLCHAILAVLRLAHGEGHCSAIPFGSHCFGRCIVAYIRAQGFKYRAERNIHAIVLHNGASVRGVFCYIITQDKR